MSEQDFRLQAYYLLQAEQFLELHQQWMELDTDMSFNDFIVAKAAMKDQSDFIGGA